VVLSAFETYLALQYDLVDLEGRLAECGKGCLVRASVMDDQEFQKGV